MELVAEIEKTIRILEARLPANIESPENQKLVKSLEGNIAEYFRNLEMAFPFDAVEQLYYKRLGIAESVKPIFEETIEELLEPIIIQGTKGDKGEHGEKGDKGYTGERGEKGERGIPGIKGDIGPEGKGGDKGDRGEQGIQGERGESGLPGEKGEQGDKGEQGEPSLTQEQTDALMGTEGKPSAGNRFVTDADPRLTDERKPKPHKHPEIQPMVYAPNIATGILSNPPSGKYKVKNLYVEPDTRKLTVEYEQP